MTDFAARINAVRGEFRQFGNPPKKLAGAGIGKLNFPFVPGKHPLDENNVFSLLKDA
jgi:hypothetical protein